jgi:hypothetical protein
MLILILLGLILLTIGLLVTAPINRTLFIVCLIIFVVGLVFALVPVASLHL